MRDCQKEIQRSLNRVVAEGRELGLQVAAYYHGELIVDAWAGIADRESGRPVDGSTLFPVFSATKAIAATIIHLLAERGKLDYDTRICEIWPEFGVNGKEAVTIRNALNHTAGIPQMPEGIGFADIGDWDRMCAEVAKLTPQWMTGTHMEYHAITYSWIVGEVVQRISGKPFARFLLEDICKPLGIEDLYVGIPDEAESRVATLEEPAFDMSVVGTEGPQAIPAWIWPLHEWMNRPDARRACVPASNGIVTAKALARHFAALLPGGVDGVELLPPSRIKTATEPLRLADGVPLNIGMGYFLGNKDDSYLGHRASVFGHGGYGGSFGFADPEVSLAVGLTKNLFSKEDAGPAIMNELKGILGIPE